MNQYSNLQIQKEVLKEASHDWKYYTLGILSMFAAVQANLTTPIFIQRIIDEVLVGGDASNLWWYCAAIIAIALLAGALNFGNRYFNDKAAEETTFRLRNKLFSKIQDQSLKFLYEQESGQLMTRATADLNIIKQYLRRNFRLGLDAIYYYVSIGIIIYIIQPEFLFVELVLLPFLLLISLIYARKARPLFKERREFFGDLSNQIQESISSIETVRSFNQQEHEAERFDESNKEYLNLYIRAEVIRGLTLPIASMLVSFAAVGIFYIGGLDIINNGSFHTSLGTLVQFNLYLFQLVTPTRLLGNFIVGYTQTNVSGHRVFEILFSDSDIREIDHPRTMNNVKGQITFDHVGFEYEGSIRILNDINLEIPADSTFAIFGSTGSGKSTLINLIPRFFDPTEGNVYLDGINLREYQLEPLRKSVSAVSQDIFLFSRTIKENIAFGRPNATEEEIITAAKAAQAHKFIVEFPDEYDTMIGERGITLSGGQQQRLTIARALLMNPKILILDDSTSSVDAETEAEIQKAMELLLDNRTTLIITQKVSSARYADKIVVLEHGEIVEYGSHEELLTNKGIYYKIYHTQKDPELEKEMMLIRGDEL